MSKDVFDLEMDLKLKKAIEDLPDSIPLEKDLWDAIDKGITEPKIHKNRFSFKPDWNQLAVACSFLMAAFALVFSTQKPVIIVQESNTTQGNYQAIRTQLKEDLPQRLEHLSTEAKETILVNLQLIEIALLEIETALSEDPGNNELIALLHKTLEKERLLIESAEKLRL